MIYVIPTNPVDPNWIQETALDGTTYRLQFRWSAREGNWYLTVSSLSDVVIAAGLKLVPGAALLRHVSDFALRPPGELIVLGTPGRDSLGTDSTLMYLDGEEVGR